MNMEPLSIACALALGLSLAAAAPAATAQENHAAMMHPTAATAAATTAPKLHAAMRGLWQGHVQHTRAYAEAVKAGDTAAATKAADDTVANAKSIANAVGGFYGAPAGEQMLTLLAGHWGGVKAMTDAEHAGDSAGVNKAMNDLTTNVDAIAAFLSSANPNLPDSALRGLLMAHVAHHSAQIREIMSGDTKAEATTWKAMQAHMDTLADALSDGIAKQFPAKAS